MADTATQAALLVAARRKRRRYTSKTDAQSGKGYRGVRQSYDSYGNPIGKNDTVEISYKTKSGAQFTHKVGGKYPRRKKHGVPADFPR